MHHLEFLSLLGGYTGSSESTLVKMPHCWKHIFISGSGSVDRTLDWGPKSCWSHCVVSEQDTLSAV